MKKLLPVISVLILIVVIIFASNISKTYAGRGCCSWHGGQAYCGSNGKWICQDGTESPSCTCSTSNYNNELDDNLGFDPTNHCYIYKSTINDLEKDKEELIEEKERLENDKDNLFMLLVTVVIIFIIYIYAKRKEN